MRESKKMTGWGLRGYDGSARATGLAKVSDKGKGSMKRLVRIAIGVAVAVLAVGMVRAQDPDDHTPSAPVRPPAGQRQRPEPLPQMPGNGGDVNRDGIIAAARASLEALKSGDVAGYEAMITDDAVIVDGNGLERKPDLVKRLAEIQVKDYTISDVRFVPVSSDNGLVAYTLTASGTRHGEAFTWKMNVSSVWERGAGRGGFVCVFEQETPVK
jgi:ketosteroid isomerase-like protein